MIPPELHRFLLELMTPSEFRDWLYESPALIEPWLTLDDYLRVLELDYDDRGAVELVRDDLLNRFVPIAPKIDRTDANALMSAIHANPDELTNYLVLGDALQLKGDPRGHVIAMQANLIQRRAYFVDEAERILLEEHRETLLGEVAPFIGRGLELDWFLGFVSRARLSETRADEILPAMFRHPSFALLRELSLIGAQPVRSALETMVKIRDVDLAVLRISAINQTTADLLPDALPSFLHLRVLELGVYDLDLGHPDLEDLELLRVLTSPSSARLLLENLAGLDVPSLERLALRIQSDDYWDEPGDIWTPLADAAFLGRLRTLELDLYPETLRVLLERTDRFTHLRELSLIARMTLNPKVLGELHERLPRATIR